LAQVISMGTGRQFSSAPQRLGNLAPQR